MGGPDIFEILIQTGHLHSFPGPNPRLQINKHQPFPFPPAGGKSRPFLLNFSAPLYLAAKAGYYALA